MKAKISKTNESLTYLDRRLDEVHMSGYDRLRAKAHLARAEAVVDLIAAAFAYIKRALTPGKHGRYRRPTTSAG